MVFVPRCFAIVANLAGVGILMAIRENFAMRKDILFGTSSALSKG